MTTLACSPTARASLLSSLKIPRWGTSHHHLRHRMTVHGRSPGPSGEVLLGLQRAFCSLLMSYQVPVSVGRCPSTDQERDPGLVVEGPTTRARWPGRVVRAGGRQGLLSMGASLRRSRGAPGKDRSGRHRNRKQTQAGSYPGVASFQFWGRSEGNNIKGIPPASVATPRLQSGAGWNS